MNYSEITSSLVFESIALKGLYDFFRGLDKVLVIKITTFKYPALKYLCILSKVYLAENPWACAKKSSVEVWAQIVPASC